MDTNNILGQQNKIEKLEIPTSQFSFNFTMAFCSLAALISILVTLFFWWMNQDAATEITKKSAEKDAIISEIVSPTYKEVEEEATAFKSAVTALSQANQSRFPMTEFLNELYTKITSDVQISSLSVTQNGNLTMTGSTKSYRTTADLVMALQSWNKLTDVKLDSVSLSESGGDNGLPASFSISATISEDAASIDKNSSSSNTSNETSLNNSKNKISLVDGKEGNDAKS